ncbi:unnamed protein product, partial [marine sediment metagenome]
DIEQLIIFIQKKIKELYKIELVPEVKIIGKH